MSAPNARSDAQALARASDGDIGRNSEWLVSNRIDHEPGGPSCSE